MSADDDAFNPEDFMGPDGRPLQPAQTTIHAAELRKLRKEAGKASEMALRIADLERREAFARAGVPLDHPAADYLIRGYQGELTPEAIKVEAIKLGVITAATTSPAEIAGHQNAQAASAGATPPGIHPDYKAQLDEMGRKQFAPSDEVGRQAHINEIIALTKRAGAGFPVAQ